MVAAEQALGRQAGFPVNPPGALPYTALAFESGKLVFRGGGSGSGAGTAAVPGATVTEAEMVAAVGDVDDEEDAGNA